MSSSDRFRWFDDEMGSFCRHKQGKETFVARAKLRAEPDVWLNVGAELQRQNEDGPVKKDEERKM